MHQIIVRLQGGEGVSLAETIAGLDLARGRLAAGMSNGTARCGEVGIEFEAREVDLEHAFIHLLPPASAEKGTQQCAYGLTPQEVQSRIAAHDLRTFYGWTVAAAELLDGAPAWTAIECPQGQYVVKVMVDGQCEVRTCGKSVNPDTVYALEATSAFDMDAWVGQSWDGVDVEQNVQCLTKPSFVALRSSASELDRQSSPSRKAALTALDAHTQYLGIEGNRGTQLWHLLGSLLEWCTTEGVDFDAELTDVRNSLHPAR